MYAYKHHISKLEVDIMKLRDIAMIAVGSMATMAYQKYNKPMMKAMKKKWDESMKSMDNALDDMM